MPDPLDEFLDDVLVMEAMLAAVESKAIHTHPHVRHEPTSHKRVRTAAHAKLVRDDPEAWRKEKRNLHTVANRQYERVALAFRKNLRAAVLGYLRSAVDEREMLKRSRAAFDEAYLAAYRLGLKASGVHALDVERKSKPMGPNADAHDREWIKSSLRDERKYWHDFLEDVAKMRAGKFAGRFTAEERIDFYVAALSHVFDAARVVGHPKHSIIYWVVNKEKEHCEKCLYLQEIGPFTRETLPGLPRDGRTCSGLTNCGCELRIVAVTDDAKWQAIRKEKNRASIVRKLAQL